MLLFSRCRRDRCLQPWPSLRHPAGDGSDVGQVLIKEGLAAPLICGATRCPPTPAALVQLGWKPDTR